MRRRRPQAHVIIQQVHPPAGPHAHAQQPERAARRRGRERPLTSPGRLSWQRLVRGAPRPPSSKSDSRNHQAILQPRRKATSGCFQTVCLRRLIRPLARSYNILTDYDAVRLSLERSEPCANAAARKSGASANRRHGQSFPPARDYASSACSATFPYECPWQLEESWA